MNINRVAETKLLDFSFGVLEKSGVIDYQAEQTAKILVWSDLIGRSNQGVWRLPILCKRSNLGIINGDCKVTVNKNALSVETVNGDNGLGHYVGHVAMGRAIELARENGSGIVGVANTNYYGAGAYYVQMAADNGMAGFAFSNSFPKVAAHGGYKPVFGTNPMAFGAPCKNGRSVLVDMATAQSAGSTVRKYQESGEPLPEGIAVDQNGHPVTDPDKLKNSTILPAGGAKGFCLALLVEILSGVLTGAGFSHQVKSLYKDFEHGGNNGNLFIVIDIKKFVGMDVYYRKLDAFLDVLRHSGDAGNNESSVLYPGESRWEKYDQNRKHGILLDEATTKMLDKLGNRLGVSVPWL